MMPKFDPAGYAELIERHRITFANGVPTMFRMIVDAPGFADRDLTSLVGMNMGGAPMPAGLLHELVAAFPNARFYRSEEHTSELQSLMRSSYAVFCLQKKTQRIQTHTHEHI